MGRLRQQKRGKGKPKYIAPSHRYAGKVIYPRDSKYAEIIALINCVGHQSPLMLIKDDKGKYSASLANVKLKAMEKIHDRAFGQTTQRTESKSIKVSGVMDADGNIRSLEDINKRIKELEEEEKGTIEVIPEKTEG